MNHRILRCALFAVLALAMCAPTVGKAQPIAAPLPQAGNKNILVLILHPLVEVYEGDTLTLPYMVEDLSQGGLTLAPLTPGTAQVSASLGSASVVLDGLGGAITYTAEKAGQESIALTVSNYFGSATGSLELEIQKRPNYDLDFLVVSQDSDETGGAFMVVFTGQGQFAKEGDDPAQGKGTSDLWFSLWVENKVFVCQMSPTVRGSSPFTITESEALAPLVPAVGEVEPFFLDLNFESMSLNASNISCSGLGGITANIPWPATSGNPDDYRMKNLYFPGEGGMATITAPKTWGYVWVERKSQ